MQRRERGVSDAGDSLVWLIATETIGGHVVRTVQPFDYRTASSAAMLNLILSVESEPKQLPWALDREPGPERRKEGRGRRSRALSSLSLALTLP